MSIHSSKQNLQINNKEDEKQKNRKVQPQIFFSKCLNATLVTKLIFPAKGILTCSLTPVVRLPLCCNVNIWSPITAELDISFTLPSYKLINRDSK